MLNSKYWWYLFLEKNKEKFSKVKPEDFGAIVNKNIKYILDLYLKPGTILSLKVMPKATTKAANKKQIGSKYFRIDSYEWIKYKTSLTKIQSTQYQLKSSQQTLP